MLCDNISVKDGVLHFAGQNTLMLAEQYGTPLYLLDEDKIREKCRIYQETFRKHFGGDARPLYASKANCFKRIYQIMKEEGMGIDVVSSGEICTAVAAGFDLRQAYFHSNNKTDADISYAMDNGVGYFVCDSEEEVSAVSAEAVRRGTRQKILLRITPGIDPHTYEAVATGRVDSKFGSAIETGQAAAITGHALSAPGIDLVGYHCHVGSQVFAEDIFERAADVMLAFAADMKARYGYTLSQLDLGGGYGVRYLESDQSLDIEAKVASVAAACRKACARYGIDMPQILMEPGRSIVADAGMTLYTAGSVKRIPGYKVYISTDGGMTDNPRYALYRSAYTCYVANRMGEQMAAIELAAAERQPAEPEPLTVAAASEQPAEPEPITAAAASEQPAQPEPITAAAASEQPGMLASIVGRCCESGDIIQEAVPVPESVQRGDIIAVCTTGAYNYSMASNYNRIPRPPIVMLQGGRSYLAVRRESLEDLIRNDI